MSAATLKGTDLIPAPQAKGNIQAEHGPEVSGSPADAGIGRDLIKAMAMDAGKNLCAYIEVMFPDVWHGQNSGFKISMKHHVYNDIMALADLHDEAAIRKRLADNEAHRKEWVGMYRKMRRKKSTPPKGDRKLLTEIFGKNAMPSGKPESMK